MVTVHIFMPDFSLTDFLRLANCEECQWIFLRCLKFLIFACHAWDIKLEWPMSSPCSKVCLEKSFIFAFKQGLVLTYIPITSSNRWFTQTHNLPPEISVFPLWHFQGRFPLFNNCDGRRSVKNGSIRTPHFTLTHIKSAKWGKMSNSRYSKRP